VQDAGGLLPTGFDTITAEENVLFKEASGAASQAQFHAFTDMREWTV